jgi:hypothetical protein
MLREQGASYRRSTRRPDAADPGKCKYAGSVDGQRRRSAGPLGQPVIALSRACGPHRWVRFGVSLASYNEPGVLGPGDVIH